MLLTLRRGPSGSGLQGPGPAPFQVASSQGKCAHGARLLWVRVMVEGSPAAAAPTTSTDALHKLVLKREEELRQLRQQLLLAAQDAGSQATTSADEDMPGWLLAAMADVERIQQQPQLPPGWMRGWADEHAHDYYYNTALGVTQWEAPPLPALMAVVFQGTWMNSPLSMSVV